MTRGLAVAAALLAAAGCGRVGFDPAGSGVGPGSDGGPSGDGTLVPGLGYFVEVPSTEGQPFGGISGANAKCLADLTSLDWLGKSDAAARGALRAAFIHAWLCSAASCFDLAPNETYAYASAVHTTAGGISFVATPEGFTADDGYAYAEVFGDVSEFREYFTGRFDDNGPQADTCGDWEVSTGETLIAVSDTPDYSEKRSKYPRACDGDARLICVVSPR